MNRSANPVTQSFLCRFLATTSLVALTFLISNLTPLQSPSVAAEPERTSPTVGGGSNFMNSISFGGPSIHLNVGYKTKKAPDEDEFYSAYGGLKGTAFSVGFGEQVYVSLLGLNVVLQRDGIFALGWSPLVIGHKFGVGLAVDFFTVDDRITRPGGKWGLSINFDIFRIVSVLTRQ